MTRNDRRRTSEKKRENQVLLIWKFLLVLWCCFSCQWNGFAVNGSCVWFRPKMCRRMDASVLLTSFGWKQQLLYLFGARNIDANAHAARILKKWNNESTYFLQQIVVLHASIHPKAETSLEEKWRVISREIHYLPLNPLEQLQASPSSINNRRRFLFEKFQLGKSTTTQSQSFKKNNYRN